MKERIVRIGTPVPLAAVGTEPEQFEPGRPAVLLLNSGVMHHVGACRLSVKLARGLAHRGLYALRYDRPGLGDSETRSGWGSGPEAAVAEACEVMDHLQRSRGIERFILFGLCSGAHTSFLAACADERVVGISMIDPYCYTTWRYYWKHYAPRVVSRYHWGEFLRRQLRRAALREGKAAQADAQFFEVPQFFSKPARDFVAMRLRALAARSVAMQVTFTGGLWEYNYRDQYLDSFRDVEFGKLLSLHYHPQANHIITQSGVQKQVVQDVVHWAATLATRGMPAPLIEKSSGD